MAQDKEYQRNEVIDGPRGLDRIINYAELLDDETLDQIGNELKTQVERDIESRSEWLQKIEQWTELTTQVMEEKTFPWPGASNIKYPLLATAAVQFHARSFPALFGNPDFVKGKVIGKDADGQKAERGRRLGTYMSYLLQYKMEDWVEDMDRLLLVLPILGAVYKKTYFSPYYAQPVSEMIHPRDFIINYDARDFVNSRKTHRLWKTPNEIISYQRQGIYKEYEDQSFSPPQTASEVRDATHGLNNSGVDDDLALQELYEIHTIMDLDEDGYAEPYIFTISADDGKVYRIVQAYSEEDVETNDSGQVAKITPTTYFTPYFFIPDPESKTHGIGFGTIIGPLNESVNTLVNQLVDAGTLSNMQGGFLSRGIRIQGGTLSFKPGEWKQVNATGDDLRKGIFPLPVNAPSSVLFSLLQLLISSAQDLSSVQDMMVGRNPGQNQPYSTSQLVMEQGLKVFNGIYKRIYRALSKEYRLLYNVLADHLDLNDYLKVLDETGQDVQSAVDEFGIQKVFEFLRQDFNVASVDIIPSAEPDMLAEAQKLMKSESLLQKVAQGLPLNVQAVTRRLLEAEQQEGIEELMNVPVPQPDPQVEIEKQKLELQQAELEIQAQQAEADANLKEAQAYKAQVEAELAGENSLHDQFIKEKLARAKEFEALTKRLQAQNANKQREAGTQNSGTS